MWSLIVAVLFISIVNIEGGYPDNVHNIDTGINYSTIQAAVDDADAGNEIHVDSGTYFEHVNITRPLIIRGVETGEGKPVVDAGMNGNGITLSAEGIVLEGFNATNGSSWHAGIIALSNNNTIIGNEVSKNNYGILLMESSNNTISDNYATNNSEGLFLFDSNDSIFYNNRVSLNTYSIYLYSSNNNTFYNNFFNDTNNPVINGINTNRWNLTKIKGTNVVNGTFIAGNYWLNPELTGFSQTCSDMDWDGICDSNYILASGNLDYLPLAMIPPENGYISGFVRNSSTDISGSVVSTNTSISTITHASGFYSMHLPAGTYNLTAISNPGFYSNSSIIVTVISGTTVEQDIELFRKQTGTITGIVSEK